MTLIFSLFSMSALATEPGDGNIEGGGGGMGDGTSTNFWNPGNDGVRITVVNAETGNAISSSVDFSNRAQSGSALHFGKINKLEYMGGATLSPQSGVAYTCLKPTNAMPTIISSGGRNNIEAIKRYFCSEYACMMVADATGVDYEDLIGGEYKLLLEPIAYFTYNGLYYCMTATQAALYDQIVSGNLRSKMASLSHQNLPLAMYLEYDDLGLTAWNGTTSGKKSNSEIISYLGVGIVRFTELPPQDLDTPDVEYRVDTDVITSITLEAGSRLTPDNPGRVVFMIMGRRYTVSNIVIPASDSQVVWVKWHTPDTPQTIEISVSVRGGSVGQDTFTAKIVDLDENPPPDPLATDTSPGYTIPSVPRNPQKATANWGVWDCYWVPDWQWHSDWDWVDSSYTDADGNEVDDGYWEDNGEWVDEGDWEYDYTAYTASISGRMSLLPDDIVPTASGKNMKSGYGVKTEVTATLSTSAPSGHYTYPQTAFSVFPEFNYQTYWRLLQRTSGGRSAKFTFKENEYSTYNRCVHFTPVWFPDNTQYVIYTQVWDTWTPDGMLSVEVTDYVRINDSLFDDWYTNRE
ncbi:MAG: hypothetical protein PHY23_00950 [Oscillospiraceae bacterium]|nr:hypothetical protein [Oscillospiraceae bacterium]